MFNRSVTKDGMCPICFQEEETVIYILWNCRASNDVWAESGSIFNKWPNFRIDFNHLWEKIRILDQNSIASVALIMRNIWVKMNELVFNNEFRAPHKVFQSVKL